MAYNAIQKKLDKIEQLLQTEATQQAEQAKDPGETIAIYDKDIKAILRMSREQQAELFTDEPGKESVNLDLSNVSDEMLRELSALAEQFT